MVMKKGKIIIISIVSGLALYIAVDSGIKYWKSNSLRMTLMSDKNQTNRYSWMLKDSLKQKFLNTYQVEKLGKRYLFTYEYENKQILYIYEVKEYQNVSINNIQEDTVLKDNFEQSPYNSAYWGNPYLFLESACRDIKTDSIVIDFCVETTILERERSLDYLYFKVNLKSLIIGENNGKIDLRIFCKQKPLPIEILFIKTIDSFYIIALRNTNNETIDGRSLLEILDLNKFQRLTRGKLQLG